MAAKIGSVLVANVRSFLNAKSPNDKFFDDADILSWLNLGYQKYVDKSGCFVRRTNVDDGAGGYINEVKSVADQSLYDIPAAYGFSKIHPFEGVVYLPTTFTNNGKLIGTTRAALLKEGLWHAVNMPGTPRYYIVRYLDVDRTEAPLSKSGMSIQILPYPVDSDNHLLEASFTPYVTEISLSTATLLDHAGELAICYFATMLGEMSRRNKEEAVNWNALFEDQVAEKIKEFSDVDPDTPNIPNRPWMAYDK